MPIRVLLADDSELVRRAIRRLLSDQPEITLVGEAVDFGQVMKMASELHPQVIILDLHMADSRGIVPAEFKSRLAQSAASMLAISIWDDEETRSLAESFGAVKLLDKVSLGTQLIPAIIQFAPRPAGSQ